VSNEERFEEIKRYVRFTDEDVRCLALLCDKARPHFDKIAREFYERAREHEEAHAVFESEEQIARLHITLVAWLERVLTGPYDADYCEKSARIGRVHVRVGLPQRYMFTAMTLFRARLAQVAVQSLGEAAPRVCEALGRILDIELALMNDTYREALMERMQRYERARKSEAHRALEQTERRLLRAVELARAFIVGLDADGRIRLFNREAERITGFAADEVVDRTFTEQFLVADGDDFGRAWLSATDAERAPVECTLRTRAGRMRELSGGLSLVPADNGDEPMIVLAARDVTDDKAVAARLRQSEKLAAVGTLAAGLAHEIRNPLNGAHLHLTFLRRALRKSSADSDASDAVDVVESEIERLSALVTDFLDFARPVALSRKAVHIQPLCNHSLEMVRPRTAGSGVTLHCELPNSELIAEIDEHKIEQVLLNLLHNAIDAAPDGGTVTLRAYRRPRDVVIEVCDDGAGIADPEEPVFDAFYSRKDSGTGLGLAIVHRIVTDHGGSVTFRSGPATAGTPRTPGIAIAGTPRNPGTATSPGSTVFEVRLPIVNPERTETEPPPPIRQEQGQ